MYVKKNKSDHKKRPVTKTKISISVSQENFDKLKECSVNKSKFIDWLLNNYYIEGGSNGK